MSERSQFLAKNCSASESALHIGAKCMSGVRDKGYYGDIILIWTRIDGVCIYLISPKYLSFMKVLLKNAKTLQKYETGLTSQFLTLTLGRLIKDPLGQLNRNGLVWGEMPLKTKPTKSADKGWGW